MMLPEEGCLLQIHIRSDYRTTFGAWRYGPVLGVVDEVIFGVKAYGDDPEENSILRINDLTGLLILNGAVAPPALVTEVSLTYDPVSYIATLVLNKAVTELLETHQRWWYELQFIHDTGAAQSMLYGDVITKGSSI